MAVSSPPSIQVPSGFIGFLVSEEALAESPTGQLELGAQVVPAESEANPASEPRDLVGVAAAADRLGVHENTIRNWIDRGILRAVRLPGGHRRLDPREIERMRMEIAEPGVNREPFEEDTQPSRGQLRGRLRQGNPEEGW